MPYADIEKRKAVKRRWFNAQYEKDPGFRAVESVRKADWLQTEQGKQSNAESSARQRAKKKAQ